MSAIDQVADTVGARIRYVRERQGWSVEDLAQRVGVGVETIEAWEDGTRDPRANRLMLMAGIMNVSAHWLLDGTGDTPASRDVDPVEAARNQLEAAKLRLTELSTLFDEIESNLNDAK